MRSWDETCMLSHLPIQVGDNIKVIILIKKHNTPCAENINFDDGYAIKPDEVNDIVSVW